jgi:acyl-CoA dehydrogenase
VSTPAGLAFVRGLVADAAVGVIGDVGALRARLVALATWDDTVERAALAGVAARSVGWAFAGGYQAALARLDPASIPAGKLAALCATEDGGAHPRAIRSSLAPAAGGTGWTLTGRKTFVSMGTDADVLFVVASTGARADGRNQLRVARVASKAAGVTLRAREPLPVVPEIGHAEASFDAVAVGDDALLPGDGYDDALKLFRTVEDVHVTAAVLGWGIGVARGGGGAGVSAGGGRSDGASEGEGEGEGAWGREWIERAVGLVVLLRALGREAPAAPETHIALAGALEDAGQLLAGAPWDRTNAAVRTGWERDRAILQVASKVRSARLETAWRTLSGNFRGPRPSNGT